MSPVRANLPEKHKAALERLLAIAKSDTGQSRRCANFLLAWWNAADNGGFDLTDLWGVDHEIAMDMVTVFVLISACHHYPDTLGYKREFEAIWKQWREPAEQSKGGAL